mmetsp:Transcript_10426/g.16904  ORF Transcript_10426/g.16904 Transcript_10426/m.16904 type:complete len:250 (+) Transcript_10426:45-794(+)
MKFFLIAATAFALVASSSVHANDDEPALVRLRGSENSEMEKIFLEMSKKDDDCEKGYKDGKKKAKRKWENSGEDCDNAWQVEEAAERMKDRNYPNGKSSTSSKSSKSGDKKKSDDKDKKKKKSYDDCARDGVDDVVRQIEKECFHDDSSQCTDLGTAAAELVILDDWCTPGGTYGASHHSTNYKKECKGAAYGICEGNIPTVANSWCPSKSMSIPEMKELQGKCKKQVNKMVPSALVGKEEEEELAVSA